MQWFYPGLITHGSSSSILEHSNTMTHINNVQYIEISDSATVTIESLQIQNPIMELVTSIFDLIINLNLNIFDLINILSFLSFWTITLIIFTQSWEILVQYTSVFNIKHNTFFTQKNLLNMFLKLKIYSSKFWTQYYL